MVAKKGRPVSENPKDYMLRVRMDEQTLQQLDECCEAENLSRSEVVRKGIQEQHSKTKEIGCRLPAKVHQHPKPPEVSQLDKSILSQLGTSIK